MKGVIYPESFVLRGQIISEKQICGTIRQENILNGKVSILNKYEDYKGPYEAESKPFIFSTLRTKDKHMTDNVTIKPIQTYEVSNPKGGITFVIG